jgi:hypothetical protein
LVPFPEGKDPSIITARQYNRCAGGASFDLSGFASLDILAAFCSRVLHGDFNLSGKADLLPQFGKKVGLCCRAEIENKSRFLFYALHQQFYMDQQLKGLSSLICH